MFCFNFLEINTLLRFDKKSMFSTVILIILLIKKVSKTINSNQEQNIILYYIGSYLCVYVDFIYKYRVYFHFILTNN